MKPQLKLTLIQQLNARKSSGFTLVELLVVIIIIGILTAIALPNFLNQTAKAKQNEAKQNINLFNKTQNAYRLENSTFATSFDVLATGSLRGAATANTTLYSYTMATSNGTDSTTIQATAKETALKGYTGGAVMFKNTDNQSIIRFVACEATAPSTTAPAAPLTPGGADPTCGAATNQITY
jgi:type IV pilus assembly protein PilA